MLRSAKALVIGITGLAVALAALGGIGYAVQLLPHKLAAHPHAAGTGAQRPPAPATAPVPTETMTVPSHARLLTGVFADGVPMSWSPVQAFADATGTKPRIALYYSGWGEQFWPSFAGSARAHGATVLVQLQPSNISMAAIAHGDYDPYLTSYAGAVRQFGHPVILGFGHEMNGTWYSWGAGHTSPAVFRAAWRHVVTVFRDAGASNVTWLWSISSLNAASSPLKQWWPGASWVNWVGVDGYYYRPSDTFGTVFGTTLTQLRRFMNKPVLISEAAIGPSSRETHQIADLFRGMRENHLLGLVWFDEAQHNGSYHQDWRLEDNPAALAAFRSAAAAT